MQCTSDTVSPESALALLRQRNLRKATQLCDEALEADPGNDAWLRIRAMLFIESGDFAAAEAAINLSIAKDRSVAAYHHVLGNALHSQTKLERAITSYRRALRLDPELAEAHNDLGTAFFEKHLMKEAEASFRESLRLNPEHEAALSNLGATLRAVGRIKEARVVFQRVLGLRIMRIARSVVPFLGRRSSQETAPVSPARLPPQSIPVTKASAPAQPVRIDLPAIQATLESGGSDKAIAAARQLVDVNPGDADAYFVLAQKLSSAGKDAVAIANYARAIAIAPDVAKYHNSLGIAYHKRALNEESVDCYRRAIQLDPTFAVAYNNLGAVLRDLDRYDLALEACQSAIRLSPAMGPAYGSMAEALTKLGRHDEATVAFERALELMPDHLETWLGFGKMYMEQTDNLDQSETCFRRALAINPNSDAAHHSLGLIAQMRGQFHEAHHRFKHAQRLSVNAVHPNFAESNLALLEGNFEKGWALYHWRLGINSQSENNRKPGTPVWDGSPLEGRSILIYGEQGLGDEIMFASCINEIIDSGSRTVIACQPKLKRLFCTSFPRAEVIAMDKDWDLPWIENPQTTDLTAAMGDLPGYLRPNAASFPRHTGYLRADSDRVAFWESKLHALGPGKKIGISWMGGTRKSWRSLRSMKLERLLPILGKPGAQFVSLQYGEAADEAAEFSASTGCRVHHWPEAISDYRETAALVTALDLTISVCTSIVHLSGALGKPVWVMAPQVPEWRYGHKGPEMIWYPSARVYRQPAKGDWDGVIQRIAMDMDTIGIH